MTKKPSEMSRVPMSFEHQLAGLSSDALSSLIEKASATTFAIATVGTSAEGWVDILAGLREKVRHTVKDAKMFLGSVTASESRRARERICALLTEIRDAVPPASDHASTDNVSALLTGLPTLDEATGGLCPGQLIVIGARPAMGKTTLALGITNFVSCNPLHVAAIFSLEMDKEELGLRLLGQLAEIHAKCLAQGKLDEAQWKRLSLAANKLSTSRLFLDDSPALTTEELVRRCRRLLSDEGRLDLVVVDYIQLMSGSTTGAKGAASRKQEISEISRSLKVLAKELGCPVVALSQLNRNVENRTDKRPTLSDLRVWESSAIEAEADIVIFVYRDEAYNIHSSETGVAELIIAKNGSRKCEKIRLLFKPEIPQFVDVDKTCLSPCEDRG